MGLKTPQGSAGWGLRTPGLKILFIRSEEITPLYAYSVPRTHACFWVCVNSNAGDALCEHIDFKM